MIVVAMLLLGCPQRDIKRVPGPSPQPLACSEWVKDWRLCVSPSRGVVITSWSPTIGIKLEHRRKQKPGSPRVHVHLSFRGIEGEAFAREADHQVTLQPGKDSGMWEAHIERALPADPDPRNRSRPYLPVGHCRVEVEVSLEDGTKLRVDDVVFRGIRPSW